MHRELLTEAELELVVYDSTGEGPANVNERVRDIDRLDVSERIVQHEHAADALGGSGLARYGDLIGTAISSAGIWATCAGAAWRWSTRLSGCRSTSRSRPR